MHAFMVYIVQNFTGFMNGRKINLNEKAASTPIGHGTQFFPAYILQKTGNQKPRVKISIS